jgi:hypothetical protein
MLRAEAGEETSAVASLTQVHAVWRELKNARALPIESNGDGAGIS